MPMHDWTRFEPNEFGTFHGRWIFAVYDALNGGLLPTGFYAMAYPTEERKPHTRRVAVRTSKNHAVVAIIEIVSPGNKAKLSELREFVSKAVGALDAGVHVLVIDPFPPGPHDPEGIHGAIWRAATGRSFTRPDDKPLTLAAYVSESSERVEAFVEPVAVGDALRDMPLYLKPNAYVNVPLEATYQVAWDAFPAEMKKLVAP